MDTGVFISPGDSNTPYGAVFCLTRRDLPEEYLWAG